VTFINPGDDPRNKDGGRTRQSSDAFGLKHLLRFCLLQPNQARERTADRHEDLLSMTSKLNPVVSGRSACSR
jgi:hypothetical protein